VSVGLSLGLSVILDPAGAAHGQSSFQVLHAFDCGTEGCAPQSGLVQGSDGNFYGTTTRGGATDWGTVFKMTPAGTLTTLHSFDCDTEGCSPLAGLIQASDGNFYGTTTYGGPTGGGAAFKMTPAGDLTTLHPFACATDGCVPAAPLIQGSDGNFYGTTSSFGAYGGPGTGGTVFKMTPAGALTTLHSFDGVTDGSSPFAGLIQASDGNFYGTTIGVPTVFKMTPAGALTTLHSFDCATDGCLPVAPLIQGSDGNFYGTTQTTTLNTIGGTAFKMTPAGDLTTLHSFDCFTEGCGSDGGLIQADDGNFYGTAAGGGGGVGTVFKMTPAGAITTLHSFVGTEGCSPRGGLIQADDGNFYGTAGGCGPNNGGAVFKQGPKLFTWPIDPTNSSRGHYDYCDDWPADPQGCYWLTDTPGPAAQDAWRDAQPFQRHLYVKHGYHLGADYNFGTDPQDQDKPVYPAAVGMVVSVQENVCGWGNILFVRHDTVFGVHTSMYAHVDWLPTGRPSVNDPVSPSTAIAQIGNGAWTKTKGCPKAGSYAYHLHFEIREGINTDPGPGYTKKRVTTTPQGQIDPNQFIASH